MQCNADPTRQDSDLKSEPLPHCNADRTQTERSISVAQTDATKALIAKA